MWPFGRFFQIEEFENLNQLPETSAPFDFACVSFGVSTASFAASTG